MAKRYEYRVYVGGSQMVYRDKLSEDLTAAHREADGQVR